MPLTDFLATALDHLDIPNLCGTANLTLLSQ